MASPILLFFWQNISLVYFVLLFLKIENRSVFFKSSHWIQKFVILFALGACISTFDTNVRVSGLANSLAVLPNYIYWSILVLFIVNIRKVLDFNNIGKYLTNGIILSVFLYHLSPIIPKIPGFVTSFSPNGFAFLTVCFTAPAQAYFVQKNKRRYAVILLGVILFTLLLEERRAGFVLVLGSSMLSIFLKDLNFKYLMNLALSFFLIFAVLQVNSVKNTISSSSPRIHELLYKSEVIKGNEFGGGEAE